MVGKSEKAGAASPVAEAANVFSANFGIIVAVLTVLLTTLLLYILLRGRVKRSTVVLFGLCDSGKTLLLSRVCHNVHMSTVTSSKSNQASFSPDGKRHLLLADVPGHERLRGSCFDAVKLTTRGLLMVVDSSSVQRQLRDVAECLYTVLTDPVINTLRPPLLVLCNKQDLPTAKSAQLVRTQMEREINTLRWTKSSGLQDTGSAGSEGAVQLGAAGKEFSFNQLPFPVLFVEGSCGADSKQLPKLQLVKDWLATLA